MILTCCCRDDAQPRGLEGRARRGSLKAGREWFVAEHCIVSIHAEEMSKVGFGDGQTAEVAEVIDL